MFALVTAFVDIILHRRGPEDLPASWFLLGLALGGYLLTGFLVIWMSEPWLRAVAILFLDVILYLSFIRLVLVLHRFPARFLQSATALLGIYVVLNSMALPFLWWLREATANDVVPVFPYAILLVLLLWSLDVSGFVVSRAISRPYVTGVVIVIGYFLLSFFVRGTIFPPQS